MERVCENKMFTQSVNNIAGSGLVSNGAFTDRPGGQFVDPSNTQSLHNCYEAVPVLQLGVTLCLR
jgi:hypothetical protein